MNPSTFIRELIEFWNVMRLSFTRTLVILTSQLNYTGFLIVVEKCRSSINTLSLFQWINNYFILIICQYFHEALPKTFLRLRLYRKHLSKYVATPTIKRTITIDVTEKKRENCWINKLSRELLLLLIIILYKFPFYTVVHCWLVIVSYKT